ncbi:hypothetical protein AMATHDRAFT_158260 [Amanita thiersii Skay4041]|uniref:Elongator complex protein 5 n=1 Tax=Amanita thiersii Skay4041 TaxID=703135 RepID=A0A2A9NBM9_9AGAR|nr:hypothetical protein AMATHDRAFT_158260 [Amanita thiersii Skay4041]
MLPPFNLPNGIVLLITDELSAPADFLLHRSLQQHLKEVGNGNKDIGSRHVTLLSVSESLARWKALASRVNLNLDQHISAGTLEIIDVLSHVAPPPASTTSPTTVLKPIFDLTLRTLEKASGASKLVILDDVSTLEWIGFPLPDIWRFTRALSAACRKAGATLIVRHHNVTPGEPDDLFFHLLQLCTYHLEVRGLLTGRSGAVSGEIALHPGAATIVNGSVNLLPRSRALQYRLTDASAVFFEKGTGAAVL